MRYNSPPQHSESEIPKDVKNRVNAIDRRITGHDLHLEALNGDKWTVRVEGDVSEIIERQVRDKYRTMQRMLGGMNIDHSGYWYGIRRGEDTWLIRFDFAPPGGGWDMGPADDPGGPPIFDDR